jgi:hypothetical protein
MADDDLYGDDGGNFGGDDDMQEQDDAGIVDEVFEVFSWSRLQSLIIFLDHSLIKSKEIV